MPFGLNGSTPGDGASRVFGPMVAARPSHLVFGVDDILLPTWLITGPGPAGLDGPRWYP